jgi:hypothetical protein
MIVESRWNLDWQGKPKFSEETCPSATFVHHKIPHAFNDELVVATERTPGQILQYKTKSILKQKKTLKKME